MKGNLNNNTGESRSLWHEVPHSSHPTLETECNVDVCIVGGGIVGLTCAYILGKAGKSVVVAERGGLGGGETSRTTGHLTWVLDERYNHLIDLFDQKTAQIVADSHVEAINYIEKTVLEENIGCDFERVDGFLFAATEEDRGMLQKEFAACQKLGLDVFEVTKSPFGLFYDTGPCLMFPMQGQFHVLKYLQGLIQAILGNGGKLFENTAISHIEDGNPCLVATKSGVKIKAQSVVIATCTPVNNRFILHTKQAPYRTYVIAGSIPKGSVPLGLFWDTAEPYHYIRLQRHLSDPNLDWLIIGGDDHKTGQCSNIESRFIALEKWAKVRFPMFEKAEYQWSGQIFEPYDSLAFIGKNPQDKNVYIATGHSGNGMTYGTIAGILISDLILDKKNPWQSIYEPSRKNFSGAKKYIQENLNVAQQYLDWFTPGELKQIDLLPVDSGVVFRKGVKKLAIYKDKNNQVHVNSAFCPHLGGCLHWNAIEKSWDCPCHGSRFNGRGAVICGPANGDLFPCKIKIE